MMAKAAHWAEMYRNHKGADQIDTGQSSIIIIVIISCQHELMHIGFVVQNKLIYYIEMDVDHHRFTEWFYKS